MRQSGDSLIPFLPRRGQRYGPSATKVIPCPVYHIFHALNHLLMFGQTYEPMVQSCLAKLG